jgi:putative DNA primase/helicase
MAGRLGNEGLSISPKHRDMWWSYVVYQSEHIDKGKAIVRIVADDTGWHGEDFVMGDTIYHPVPREDEDGAYDVITIPAVPHPDRPNIYGCKGTLEGWQEIAKLALGNDTAMWCIATAFAGPLMPLCSNNMGGAYHMYCDSSTGKSTSGNMAGSVYGKPSTTDKEGFVTHLHSTSVGIEINARMRNNTVLVNDEFHLAAEKERLKIAYMLEAGRGKGRGNVNIELREALTWVVPTICFDERSFESLVAEHDPAQATRGGSAVRVADIKLEPHSTKGLFPELHGCRDSFELIRKIEKGIHENYGVAGRAFLGMIVGAKGAIQDEVQRRVDVFAEELAKGYSSQVHRVATRFALSAVAGEMVIEFGILPWPPGSVEECAKRMFRLFVKGCGGGTENIEVVRGKASMREYIIENMRSLIPLRDMVVPAAGDRPETNTVGDDNNSGKIVSLNKVLGYVFTHPDDNRVLIYGLTENAFKAGCNGVAKDTVAKALKDEGFLVCTEGTSKSPARYNKKHRVPASMTGQGVSVNPYLYWVKASFVEEE